MVRVSGRDDSGLVGAGVQGAMAGLAVGAAVDAFGCDCMFGGTQRESRVMIQQLVLADETKSATKLSRSAGVRDQVKTTQSGGEFRFDNFDGRNPGVGLIDIGAGDAVFAAASAGAAAEDLILHIALAGLVAASADDDRTAAAAVADLLVRRDLTGGFQQRLHQGMNGGVIRVYRSGKARIYHTALANFDVDHFCQTVVNGQRRVRQAGEEIAAGGAYDGGADIRRAFGLIGASSEIEKQMVAFFLDPHMEANRLVEIDTVAVDEPFALAGAVRPRSDFSAHLCFGHGEQLLV